MDTVLIGQSLLSGLFSGGMYALVGLGLTLSWRYLRVINLSQFALTFAAAYFVYEFSGHRGGNIVLVTLVVAVAMFFLAIIQQMIIDRFKVNEFASVLITFGLAVMTEAGLQAVWSADLLRMESEVSFQSLLIGPFYIPLVDAIALSVAILLAVGIHLCLHFTLLGKALRASIDNPSIASAFGVPHRRLSYVVAGSSGALAAIAGAFVAMIFTLAPSQIFAWFGVVFAAVLIGGLGSPLGLLGAGVLIGVLESGTMALASPTLAPLVSFSILIFILVFWPERL